MRSILRVPLYALIAGSMLAATGCVVAPDHEHDRAYSQSSDPDYRNHERQEAYRHCREAGEHDCDDLLHHD